VGANTRLLPLMLKLVLSGLSVQVNPAGNASVKETPVALPVPMLLTVTVKPICAPALTVAASAVFSTLMSGHCTVTLALALLLVLSLAFSLVAEAEAVFDTGPQLADEVVATTWTVKLPPAAMVVGAK